MNRTNVGRQMVGDLGNFVGRDLGSQFMSKPQRLAEGDVVEEAEVELEEVTYTRADGSTVTYQYNPLTHEKPGMDGRMLKKGIDYDAVATQGGLGEFYETATAVEAPAAAAAGPARPQQQRRPIPINQETSADAEALAQDRDQLFNPLTEFGKDYSQIRSYDQELMSQGIARTMDPFMSMLTKGIAPNDPDRVAREMLMGNPKDYIRAYTGPKFGQLVRNPKTMGFAFTEEETERMIAEKLAASGKKQLSADDLKDLYRQGLEKERHGTPEHKRGEITVPRTELSLLDKGIKKLLVKDDDDDDDGKDGTKKKIAAAERGWEKLQGDGGEAAKKQDGVLGERTVLGPQPLETGIATDFLAQAKAEREKQAGLGTLSGERKYLNTEQLTQDKLPADLTLQNLRDDLGLSSIQTTEPPTDVVLPPALSPTIKNLPSINQIAESLSRREKMPGNLTRLGLGGQDTQPSPLSIEPTKGVVSPFTLSATDGRQGKEGQLVSKPDIDTGFPLGGGQTRTDVSPTGTSNRLALPPSMLPPPPDDEAFGKGSPQSLIERDIREAQRESERENAPPAPRWGTELHTAPAPKSMIERIVDQQIEAGKKIGADVISGGEKVASVLEDLVLGDQKSVDPTMPGPLSLTREDEIAEEADRRDRPGPFTGWGGQQVDAFSKIYGDASRGLEKGLSSLEKTITGAVSPFSNYLQNLIRQAGAGDDGGGGGPPPTRSRGYLQQASFDPGPTPTGFGGMDITDPYYGGGGEYITYDPSIYEDEIGITFDDTSVVDNPFVEGPDLGGGGGYYDDWAVEDDDSQIWATGGPVRFAQGGGLESVADQYLQPGSYVLSADVMSGLGNGSSAAGFERLSGLLGIPMPGTETSVNAYSGGPMLGKIEGPGDGTSDSIHTVIQSSDGKSGQQAARVAREEGVLTPESLKEMDRRFGTGKGDLRNAHTMMNNMMANVRKVKSGGSQPKDIIGQRQDPLKGLLGLFQKA